VKCHNCDRPAIVLIGPKKALIPLCVNCRLIHVQTCTMEENLRAKQMNFHADMMESLGGIPGLWPRYAEQKIPQTTMTTNHVNIHGSSVGVVNLGQLEMVKSAITVLRDKVETQDIANGIQRLTEAIARSELTQEKKSEAVQIVTTVASEATVPFSQRKKSVVKILLAELPKILGTSNKALEVFHELLPLLTNFFH
jgi:hypothetical protein